MGRKKSRGQHNIDWIENFCRIPEGPKLGQTLKLRDWQCHEIKKIYNNKHGTRRAIISFGRKNGKTSLAAFLLLLHLCGPEHKKNRNCFQCAIAEQAALIFALAAKIVRCLLCNAQCVRSARRPSNCSARDRTIYRAFRSVDRLWFVPSLWCMTSWDRCLVRVRHYATLETATGAQSIH